MMKVSIVIPVYNIEKYLSRLLECVQNQSFKDFEAIIVNDGSTDQSLSVIEPFLTDRRFSVITTPNRGLASARNKGIETAKGEYIYFLDSDDLIAPNLIEILVDQFNKDNSIDVVAFSCKDFYDEPAEIGNTRIDQREAIDDHEVLLRIINGNFPLTAWSYFTKRRIFLDNQISFPDGRLFEDESTTVKLYGSIKKIIYLTFDDDQPGYFYRKNRPDSIMNKFNKQATPQAIEDRKYYMKIQYEIFTNQLGKDLADTHYFNELTSIYRKSADSLKATDPKYYDELRHDIYAEAINLLSDSQLKLTYGRRWKLLKIRYDWLRKLSEVGVKMIGK